MTMRILLLRGALALAAASTALLAAGPPELRASAGGCSVSCANGTTCRANPGDGERCTCTCSLYGGGAATCTCEALRPEATG
jgi:hypothetical protein